MNRQKIIELALNHDLIDSIGNDGTPIYFNKDSDIFFWFMDFVADVRKEVLEEAAKNFDSRGKTVTGDWSEGFYDPPEPGEILRRMKECDV